MAYSASPCLRLRRRRCNGSIMAMAAAQSASGTANGSITAMGPSAAPNITLN